MKLKSAMILTTLFVALGLNADVKIPKNALEDKDNVMSKAYWELWNPEVQAKIDRDIEANRKADMSLSLEGATKGTSVKVEQISHSFIFGAHIFNFDQLGDKTLNNKYKNLYGSLFNSATVAFYWTSFEMQPNRKRFNAEEWDSQEYWEKCDEPKLQVHWRRPAPEKIIEFCKERGVRIHGHPLIWSNSYWHHPNWLFKDIAKGEERKFLDTLIAEYGVFNIKSTKEKYTQKYKDMSADEIAKALPNFSKELKRRFDERIIELANKYGDTIQSWDVVNESAVDYARGLLVPNSKICKSSFGIMVGDYTYEAFKTAGASFPKSVQLNINDYATKDYYPEQIKDLISRGCKIDIVGSQMHLFNPKQTRSISAGAKIQTPEIVWNWFKKLDIGRPIHLSEITITAAGESERDRMMQAIITRNLYRLWFSIKPMMGITWWNVVDDCGAYGEPSYSGMFTRVMKPKPAFHALDELINKEWKTNIVASADKDGKIQWRGFKGKYRLSWKGTDGKERFKYVEVK